MATSAVELDFFRLEKESSPVAVVGPPPPSPQKKKLLSRRKSFREIQSVISKMNPELLKTVIESGSVNQTNQLAFRNAFSVPSTPNEDRRKPFPTLPVFTPSTFRPTGSSDTTPETAPLTIFYNGTVAVFDVPPHKAENIMKLAHVGVPKAPLESTKAKPVVSPSDQRQILETLNGDLPMARRKSLYRFLEKRKERLTFVSPYGCPSPPTDAASSGKPIN